MIWILRQSVGWILGGMNMAWKSANWERDLEQCITQPAKLKVYERGREGNVHKGWYHGGSSWKASCSDMGSCRQSWEFVICSSVSKAMWGWAIRQCHVGETPGTWGHQGWMWPWSRGAAIRLLAVVVAVEYGREAVGIRGAEKGEPKARAWELKASCCFEL